MNSKSAEKLAKLTKLIKECDEIVIEEYDNWENFLKDIGIFSTVRTKYSNQEVLDSLTEFCEKYSYISSTKYEMLKWKPSLSVICDRFGTWNNALKIAGVDNIHEYNSNQIDDTNILNDLKEGKKALGENFNSKTYRKWALDNNKISVTTAQRRFGSWSNAVKLINDDKTK